jgi:DNA polymerase III alpha subunit
MIAFISDIGESMGYPKTQADWERRAAGFLKAKATECQVTYEELAKRMKKHGLAETKASVTNKLARGTFPIAFFLAALAALEVEGVHLEEI